MPSGQVSLEQKSSQPPLALTWVGEARGLQVSSRIRLRRAGAVPQGWNRTREAQVRGHEAA